MAIGANMCILNDTHTAPAVDGYGGYPATVGALQLSALLFVRPGELLYTDEGLTGVGDPGSDAAADRRRSAAYREALAQDDGSTAIKTGGIANYAENRPGLKMDWGSRDRRSLPFNRTTPAGRGVKASRLASSGPVPSRAATPAAPALIVWMALAE